MSNYLQSYKTEWVSKQQFETNYLRDGVDLEINIFWMDICSSTCIKCLRFYFYVTDYKWILKCFYVGRHEAMAFRWLINI